jgi:hypothetical protein
VVQFPVIERGEVHALTTDRTTMPKPGGPYMRACTPAPSGNWSANTTRIHVLATAFGGARRPQELPT